MKYLEILKLIANLIIITILVIVIVGLLKEEAKADSITKVGNGTFIVEDFDCTVANLDYTEFQRRLSETPRTDWKYEIFMFEYKVLVDSMDEYECKVGGTQDEN